MLMWVVGTKYKKDIFRVLRLFFIHLQTLLEHITRNWFKSRLKLFLVGSCNVNIWPFPTRNLNSVTLPATLYSALQSETPI